MGRGRACRRRQDEPEIAQELGLSERTAQNHVQHVLTKLSLSDRSQIVAWVTMGDSPGTGN
ncbi:MAG: response regulator transcription factor [Dermatophilaceae bacterium]